MMCNGVADKSRFVTASPIGEKAISDDGPGSCFVPEARHWSSQQVEEEDNDEIKHCSLL